MKFAHIADVHIGSWRESKLREAATEAFFKAIDICIEEDVDFILIAGDLFNTSLPPVDWLKQVVLKLRDLLEKDIPVYLVPGSHDFSPSGKTMLDVLEAAKLLKNVVRGEITDDNSLRLRFTVDRKTGAKITGLLGKKGMLEKKYYERLMKEELERETGFRIFMFHTALTEFKPKGLEQMDSSPLSFLPKNLDYYAGGHVHAVLREKVDGYGLVAMPGALFPCNFKELEEQQRGGFYIYDGSKDEPLSWRPVQLYNVHALSIDCDGKTPEQVMLGLEDSIKGHEFYNTIVTLRLSGTLNCTRITEIDFKGMFNRIYEQGAYLVLKNTSALTTREFEEIKIDFDSVQAIEESVVKEHIGQVPLCGLGAQDEFGMVKDLLSSLDIEKAESESMTDFRQRIKENSDKLFDGLLRP